LPENIKLNSPSESWDSRPNIMRALTTDSGPGNEILNQFTCRLDCEIKKIYLFFQKKERDLYIAINSHLHIRETFNTFNTYNIMKEYEELCLIANEAKNLTSFVNMNMIALKHSLLKFDYYFEKYYSKQCSSYIERKIKAKNSDLLYILQFKVTLLI
jgi:SPX domain protein involved in polyphosphate accumulation